MPNARFCIRDPLAGPDGGALPCRLCRPAPAHHRSHTRPHSFSFTHTHTHCYTCLRIPSAVHTVRLQLEGSLPALFLWSAHGLTDLCTRSSVFISAGVGVRVILVETVRFSMHMCGQVRFRACRTMEVYQWRAASSPSCGGHSATPFLNTRPAGPLGIRQTCDLTQRVRWILTSVRLFTCKQNRQRRP